MSEFMKFSPRKYFSSNRCTFFVAAIISDVLKRTSRVALGAAFNSIQRLFDIIISEKVIGTSKEW